MCQVKNGQKFCHVKPYFFKVDQVFLCQTLFSFIFFYFQGPKGFKGDKGDRVTI